MIQFNIKTKIPLAKVEDGKLFRISTLPSQGSSFFANKLLGGGNSNIFDDQPELWGR